MHPLRRTPCFPLFLPPSLLYLSSPLLYLSSFLFFSLFFLPPQLSHLFLLLSLSSVPIFFSSSPPSCLLFIMSFSFVSLPPLSLLSTAFSSVPVFFFLRELLVLCALRELLVLYALRELFVLYALRDCLYCMLSKM